MKRLLLQLTSVCCLLLSTAFGADNSKLVPALGWNVEQQGGFPTSIAADAKNTIWVGTEDKGIWRYDPREKKWTQFTAKDGLGDDHIYALAVDKQNRVWAGHLNHGVSVWNGEKWRNYGLLDGPLGDRVFAIAVCPTDGDIWIATELGVTRYSVAKDDWDYYTRGSGLPSDQIQCIAFAPNGDIFLGTQCDGVTMADAKDKYRKWNTVAGPLRMPNAPMGEGLPSSLINDIILPRLPADALPAPAGEALPVGVATPDGIAGSPDGGTMWGFMRGADWQEKINGLYNPPPAAAAQVPALGGGEMLLEDWMTNVEQDEESNRIWIAYYRRGLEWHDLTNPVTATHADTGGAAGTLVRAMCFPPKSPGLFAVYDRERGGLKMLETAEAPAPIEPLAASDKTAKSPAPLPAPAKAPAAESFEPMADRVDALEETFEAGEGMYLGDDWRTGGNWVGHYGGSFALLCGMGKNAEDQVYENEPGYGVKLRIGPHHVNDGPVRYVGTATAASPRALYNPSSGHRSEAEANDGSFDEKMYPPTWEGPDLWLDVTVPDGMHCLSLYFQNYDAQTGSALNKLRDFDVQLLPWSENASKVQTAEPIARTRVRDFWGGVYKQFVVCGPAQFVVRVGRNHSFVAKVQGVFLDRLTDTGLAERKPLPGFESGEYLPPALDENAPEENDLVAAAHDLWTKLDEAFETRGTIPLQLPLRIWAYRAAVAGKAAPELLKQWRWQIGIWTPEDHEEFKTETARAFKKYSEEHPEAVEKPEADE